MKVLKLICFFFIIIPSTFLFQSCCQDDINYLDIIAFDAYPNTGTGILNSQVMDTINAPFQLRATFKMEESKCKNGSATIKDYINLPESVLMSNLSFMLDNEIVPPQTNLLELPGVTHISIFELYTIDFNQAFLDRAVFQEENYNFSFFVKTVDGLSFSKEIDIPFNF